MSYWNRKIFYTAALLAAISASPSAARDACPGGAEPRGEIVALDGTVTGRASDGTPFQIDVGTRLCTSDQIETGARSRVEFRLTGKNTTTGSSSNSVTIIPDSEDACLELTSGVI